MASSSMTAPTALFAAGAPALDNASLLDRIVERQADVASRYQPVMGIDDSIKRFEALRTYIEKALVDGTDYGKVPGVDKPFLFKSGAQKLCMLFGYVPHYESRVMIEDWSGEKFGEPLFYYQYACVLSKDGKPVGEGIGSANSWESKYRYRWVSEEDARRQHPSNWEKFPRKPGTVTEFDFAVEKAETSGPYGKPAEYWKRFHDAIADGTARKVKKKIKSGAERDAWEIGSAVVRVPNDQFPDVINTCQKQGEKRAYVEATLSATGASQFFTQDEDAMGAMGIDTGGHPVGTQAAADHVAQQKIAEAQKQKEQAPPQRKPSQGVEDAWAVMKKGKYEALGVLGKLKDAMIAAFGEEKGDEQYRQALAKYIPQTDWDKEEKRPKATGFTEGTWGGDGNKGKQVRFNAMMQAVWDLFEILEAEMVRQQSAASAVPDDENRDPWGAE